MPSGHKTDLQLPVPAQGRSTWIKIQLLTYWTQWHLSREHHRLIQLHTTPKNRFLPTRHIQRWQIY